MCVHVCVLVCVCNKLYYYMCSVNVFAGNLYHMCMRTPALLCYLLYAVSSSL